MLAIYFLRALILLLFFFKSPWSSLTLFWSHYLLFLSSLIFLLSLIIDSRLFFSLFSLDSYFSREDNWFSNFFNSLFRSLILSEKKLIETWILFKIPLKKLALSLQDLSWHKMVLSITSLIPSISPSSIKSSI